MRGDLELTDDVPGGFSDSVRRAFAERPGERFTLVLSGGPTARRCYERLASDTAGARDFDWRLVDVLMGDERCVPADDPDANQRLVRESLLDQVGDVGSFQPMDCGQGAPAYEEVVGAFPALDMIHLGLGPDGHTASLFPGSDALETSDQRLVVESVDPNGRNPHRRMTLTLRGIGRARLAVFTVVGGEKADALRAVCSGGDVPAARVRAGSVRWLVDRKTLGNICS